MKRNSILFTLLMLCLSVPAFAIDAGVDMIDTITAGLDSVANHRFDTLYAPSQPPWLRLTSERYWAQIYWGSLVPFDSNFAGDTLKAQLQYSMNGVDGWTAWGGVINILNGSSDLDTLVNRAAIIDRDSAFSGEYWRCRFIYHDSLEATDTTLLGKAFRKRFELRLSEVK